MAQNSRQESRRRRERRKEEKRKIKYAFGSPEWIKEIKKHYAMWPKEDRRIRDRRKEDRRTKDRRTEIRVAKTSSKDLARKGVGLLSDDEKAMLNDLLKTSIPK